MCIESHDAWELWERRDPSFSVHPATGAVKDVHMRWDSRTDSNSNFTFNFRWRIISRWYMKRDTGGKSLRVVHGTAARFTLGSGEGEMPGCCVAWLA